MRGPRRIVPFVGGMLFIALALGIVLPPLIDELTNRTSTDSVLGSAAVALMLLFFGAAPAFVGVRLIQRAVRREPHTLAAPPPPAHGDSGAEIAATARSEMAHANRSRSARLAAFADNPLGLAIVVGVATIPLMILLSPSGAYVATLALTIYAIIVIGMTAVRPSWVVTALTSAGTGLMLFIVLGATAGALVQGEGNNPVLVLPGALFYLGIGMTGIARLFTRR